MHLSALFDNTFTQAAKLRAATVQTMAINAKKVAQLCQVEAVRLLVHDKKIIQAKSRKLTREVSL